MPRVIWKGHISFGLVQIPVGLYPATEDAEMEMHLVDRRDLAPVGYKRVNKMTGEEVAPDVVAKAVEAPDGGWVLLDDAEIAAASPEATKSIDIVAFVDGDRIDPRYLVKPYYVAPERRTAKAYALLRETLRRTGKVGIARVVLRTRQYLAGLLVRGDVLVLELLRYADEVRDPGAFELPKADLAALGVGATEQQMAELLVKTLEAEWDPAQYHDEFRAALEKIIDEKARTGRVTVPTPSAGPAPEPVDIMALLKRSLEALGAEGAGGAGGARTSPPEPPPPSQPPPRVPPSGPPQEPVRGPVREDMPGREAPPASAPGRAPPGQVSVASKRRRKKEEV
jgi:DNA end-binding protein Ku